MDEDIQQSLQDWIHDCQSFLASPAKLSQNVASLISGHSEELLYAVFENWRSNKEAINTLCHELFGLFRVGKDELRRFTLQFLPSLMYVYLSGLANNEKKDVSSIQTLLLGLYNLEVCQEADRAKTSSFRLPSLAQPSIYHEPLGLAPAVLTETALRRLDPANRITITWGPQPHIHLFNSENRLSAMAALLRIYGDQLNVFSKNSLEESCLAFTRIVAQGFTRQSANAPRIAVSSELLVEISRILFSLTSPSFAGGTDCMLQLRTPTAPLHRLEDSAIGNRARQALDSVQQRAEYELLPAPLLVSYACSDSAHLSVKAMGSNSTLMSNSASNTSARALWKSMITNASFRTRKLPDDITVTQDPTSSSPAAQLATQQHQQHQQPHSTQGVAQPLGSITEEADEPSTVSKFRITELSNLVKKRDKPKNPEMLSNKAKAKLSKTFSGKASNGDVVSGGEESGTGLNTPSERSNGESGENVELRRRSSELHPAGTLVTQM